MAGTETKRIIELTEASTVQSGDFIAVDSNARGTKKVPTSALATSAALTAETNARTGADEQMSERMDGIEEQTALIQNPTKTLSGALCSFTDGADMPMVACTAEIVPKQSGTGTPSPDNVRPISGWESVNIDVSGINVWDEEWENGYITASGAMGSSSTSIRSKNFTLCKPNTQYHCTNPAIINICWYDSLQTFISRVDANGRNIISPSNAHYFKVSAYGYGATYNNNIAVTYPSTFTDYEPYNGTTTTVNLGRTVYGGTLDVVSGVLTMTHEILDLGSLTWQYNSSYGSGGGAFYSSSKNFGYVNDADAPNMACSMYPVKSRNTAYYSADPAFFVTGNAQTRYATVRDTRYTDPTAFKTAMNGVQLVYPTNDPQTYQLTPTEIQTLLGENNVWADSGDVEITYRRDISIVLENLENALSGSNSLNTMMMSAPTENTTEEPTEDEAEDDMR